MSHLNNHAYYYGIIKEYFDSLVNDPRTDFKSLNSLVAKIQDALWNLRMSYAGQQVTVNYSDPMTRLAYLYYYVPAYAMMTDLLWCNYKTTIRSKATEALLSNKPYKIGFFGAGPGSEALAALSSIQYDFLFRKKRRERAEKHFPKRKGGVSSSELFPLKEIGPSLEFRFFDNEKLWEKNRKELVDIAKKLSNSQENSFIFLPTLNAEIDLGLSNFRTTYKDLFDDLDMFHFQYCMNETLASSEIGLITLKNLQTIFTIMKHGSRIVIIDNRDYEKVEERIALFENTLPEGSIKHSFSEPLRGELFEEESDLLDRDGRLVVRGKDDFPLQEYRVPTNEPGKSAKLKRFAKSYINCGILIVEKE